MQMSSRNDPKLLGTSASLVVTGALLVVRRTLLGAASLLVTSATLLVTMFASRNKSHKVGHTKSRDGHFSHAVEYRNDCSL